jgi:hypothetical protein
MQQSADFIVGLFGKTTGRVFLTTLPNPELKGTPEGEPNERHIWTRNSEQIGAFVAKWNRPGRATYLAVSTFQRDATSRHKDTVQELIALHADIDFKSTIESAEEISQIVQQLTPPPSLVIHSGHGLHLYWVFKEPIPATAESKVEHERLLRRLADHLGADTSVAHCAALMRLPGTTNSKNGDALLVHVITERPNRYTCEELKTWLEAAAPVIHRKADAGNGASPDNPFEAFAKALGADAPLDVEQLLAAMVYLGPGGGGNAYNTLLRAMASLARRGVPAEEAIARGLKALTDASARSGVGFDPVREAAVIAGLYRSGAEKFQRAPEDDQESADAKAEAKTYFEGIPLTIDEWLSRDLPPLDPLVGSILSTTTRALLAAPTGIGKTNFGMALFGHAGAGKNFLHWRIARPCRMLFIDGEMSRRLLRERIEALTQHLNAKPEWALFFSKEDIEDFAPLNTREGHAAVWKLVEEVERRLDGPLDAVSFDNIVSLLVGDMKEEDAWRNTMPLVRALTKRRIGQLWMHHTGHDTSHGYGTKTREWQLDLVMLLTETKRPDADVSFTLRFPKARERTPDNRDDFAETNIALVDNRWIGELTTGGKENPAPLARRFFEALQAAASNSSLTHISGYPIAGLDEWQAQCVASGLIDPKVKPDAARSMFSKYKLQLIAANWIAANTEAAWILP